MDKIYAAFLIFLSYFGIRFSGESKKRSEALNKLQEVIAKEYELSPGEPDPVFEENEIEMQRKINSETGVVTLYTVVFKDENNDGVADYLDSEI